MSSIIMKAARSLHPFQNQIFPNHATDECAHSERRRLVSFASLIVYFAGLVELKQESVARTAIASYGAG
jgi:hypothetical protein